jgi:hypothetical protein
LERSLLDQPNIKAIQIQLTGFLEQEAAGFCKELWDLMLSAQDSEKGVPAQLLEEKKREIQAQVNTPFLVCCAAPATFSRVTPLATSLPINVFRATSLTA